MKITWVGHACFLIDGREARILTDPFDEEVPYTFVESSVDIVTVSHAHFDHNAVHRVPGDHEVIDSVGDLDVSGVPVQGIASFHDDEGGARRGPNVLYRFVVEGIPIAHLGDLGSPLDSVQRAALEDVEILFAPVGGHFTIDAAQAAEIVRSLPNLRLVIPMHFKTERIDDWPIETVEPFEEMMDNVRRIGASTVEVTRESLPKQLEVWILDHA